MVKMAHCRPAGQVVFVILQSTDFLCFRNLVHSNKLQLFSLFLDFFAKILWVFRGNYY